MVGARRGIATRGGIAGEEDEKEVLERPGWKEAELRWR